MIDTSKLQKEWGYGGIAPLSPGQTTTTAPGTAPKYPSEWGQAGDVWSQMAGGNYQNQGSQWLSDWMNQGGMASKLGEWGAAQKPAMMDDYTNMVKQMAEQAGVGGTRYSSGLQGQIANYGGQLQNQFQKNLMDQMMGAYGQDVGTAGGMANFGLGAQNTGLEGLFGLGGAKNDYGLSLYDRMFQQQQADQSNQLNWAQMLNQAINGTANTQQTYQPTAGTDIMSILAGMPWGDISGGKNKGAGIGNGGWA